MKKVRTHISFNTGKFTGDCVFPDCCPETESDLEIIKKDIKNFMKEQYSDSEIDNIIILGWNELK